MNTNRLPEAFFAKDRAFVNRSVGHRGNSLGLKRDDALTGHGAVRLCRFGIGQNFPLGQVLEPTGAFSCVKEV